MSQQGPEDPRPERPTPFYGGGPGGPGDPYDPDADPYDAGDDPYASPTPLRPGTRRPPQPPGRRPGPRDMRVIGIIAALGLLVAVLLLPPVSLLDRGQPATNQAGSGYTTRERSSMPSLPDGLEAASGLYDIQGKTDVEGPVTLTVRLSKPSTDTRSMAFYTYAGDEWRRLASVSTVDDGKSAQGQLVAVPANIAVLRRASFAHSLGAMLGPGDALHPEATNVGVVSVLAAEPSAGDEGLQLSDRLTGSLRGRFLGVTTGTATGAAAINRILTDPATVRRHVDAIIGAVATTQADGVHVDYLGVEPARRGAYTAFVEQLAERLKRENRGLVVTVPTPAGSAPDAYDWIALQKAATAVWLRAPADPATYYDQLETALRSRRENGVDLAKVSLVIDRRSRERAGDVIRAITLRDALTTASAIRARVEQGIGPGDAVALSGANIDQDAGNSGLRWDDRSRSVMFAYAGRSGSQTIWIENRFSIAFRLDLARRYNLGGVVVEGATKEEALPDVWDTILAYTNDGQLTLQTPYGPYLQPTWRASDGQIETTSNSGGALWRAPARPGTYQVTLIVSDGVAFVGQQLDLNVTPGGGRTPTPTASPTPTQSATPAGTRTSTPTATASATASPKAAR